MIRPATTVLLLCAALALPVRATPVEQVRKSLVSISTASQEPNYQTPWAPGRIRRGAGSGFVIAGNRILSNAHVVSNARFLSLEKENDPEKYVAVVEHIAHDCDLAVLKVLDPAFFKDTVPLALGGIPELESTVTVYGYPIGGERLSVTRGVVSRVDFRLYTHSGMDSHLCIQIDAAINPGNSGGPVLQDGRVVGVAFQGYSGQVAQNVGYMIPVPVIRRFLKDIEDGAYDRYMDLMITTFPLQNPAHRRALGLDDDGRGIMVSNVTAGGCSEGRLQKGDVLTGIDGHPIAADGLVSLDGERVEMSEVVERKFKGDKVQFSILRDRKAMEVTVPLDAALLYQMQAYTYEVLPRYVVFAGLVFQPLSRDFLEASQVEDLRVRYLFEHFIADEIFKEHPEVVVLSSILADPINSYLAEFRNGILREVNGRKIRTLREAAEALAQPAEHCVLRFEGKGRPLVLERSAVEAARERIKARYNVVREQNLEERPR
jgi:S1-C subfamily serine protease